MRRVFIAVGVLVFLIIATGIYLTIKNHRSSDELILYGNVDVRKVDLGFRVPGRVAKMFFEEGDYVPQGALMGLLDKQPFEDKVHQAEANLESIKTSLVNAEVLFKRREGLVNNGGVSQEDFENSRTNRDKLLASLKEAEAGLGVALTNLKDTEVFAPVDGTILTRIREPGTVVRESDPIYTLSILSPVWVRAFVSEPSLGLIYPGMEAEVITDTEGAPTYKGHIGFISPMAEFTPKTVETTQLRTDLVYRLRIVVDNPDKGLRQGMPVTVRLPLKPRSDEESR